MQKFNVYVVIISIILVIIGLTLNVVFGQTQEKFVDFNTNNFKVNILSINLILYNIDILYNIESILTNLKTWQYYESQYLLCCLLDNSFHPS
jgi:hypothetical protein